MYNSDWHIHSEASYDAELTLKELISSAQKMGLKQFGITDHANYNTHSFMGNIHKSKCLYEMNRCEGFYLGVELTPISRPLYDHCALYGTMEGYIPISQESPYEIELALSLDEMRELGILYAVGAAHWVLNVPYEQDKIIREWHRQQMYLACDPRVDILGHTWRFWGPDIWCDQEGHYFDKPWFSDFDVIPRSMHDELAAALKENNVCIEANSTMILGERYPENFYRKYNEYLRYMFEKGVRITFGSDSHGPQYHDLGIQVEAALGEVGFKSGDFSSPVIHTERL
ncbi:MAG: histidinol phosphate phosphatase HisJ family [Eubacterium sp.]|nr:histidinol phosphate phosphatase HisJ family [Eubacterium sp.]